MHLVTVAVIASLGQVPADGLDRCNVVWAAPGKDSSGSMPLGNGDVGVNLWVEAGGDLLMLLSKTDAWDAHCRLLKLGRVRVKLTPNPFAKGLPFRQELKLRRGCVEIVAGKPAEAVKLRVWVDAHRPVVRVEAQADRPIAARADLEIWRRKDFELTGRERDSARGVLNGGYPLKVPGDRVVDAAGRVVWYHRNVESCWPVTLKVQGLGKLLGKFADPLLHRTFGGAMTGPGLVKAGATALRTAAATRRFRLSIHALTRQPATEKQWLADLEWAIEAARAADRAAHEKWWADFWNRSWIYASGTAVGGDLDTVTQTYQLQRFLNACGGRGAQPIKFNGSIFTVDGPGYGPDYRRWGGCYWWQNTRLPYWAMIPCGDWDLMGPLLRMYGDMLPLRKDVTRIYYGHGGAFFAETMYFWGTPCNDDHRWKRGGQPDHLMLNPYIRREWQGGLELAMMMLDRYDYTQDAEFARTALVPLADAVLTFYDKHYPREKDHTLRIDPAQSLETWWKAVNPMPEVAGLRAVLARMLALPTQITSAEQRKSWKKLAGQVPPIPTRKIEGRQALAAAAEFSSRHNCENPELYAIFPYRLFGLERRGLDVARWAFEKRLVKGSAGWQQDPVQSAMLGLADTAGRLIVRRSAAKHAGSRFPAFWGPNFDWVPDQDHGGNNMMGLQAMALQPVGRKLLLLPAWPKGWDVHFKLHAPYRTTVECIYRGGKIERLKVSPPERARDIVRMGPPGASEEK